MGIGNTILQAASLGMIYSPRYPSGTVHGRDPGIYIIINDFIFGKQYISGSSLGEITLLSKAGNLKWFNIPVSCWPCF